jgi:hypothetical protein
MKNPLHLVLLVHLYLHSFSLVAQGCFYNQIVYNRSWAVNNPGFWVK